MFMKEQRQLHKVLLLLLHRNLNTSCSSPLYSPSVFSRMMAILILLCLEFKCYYFIVYVYNKPTYLVLMPGKLLHSTTLANRSNSNLLKRTHKNYTHLPVCTIRDPMPNSTTCLISIFNDRWSTLSSGVWRTPFMATPFLLMLVTASCILSWSDEMRPLTLISSNSTGTFACLCMNTHIVRIFWKIIQEPNEAFKNWRGLILCWANNQVYLSTHNYRVQNIF